MTCWRNRNILLWLSLLREGCFSFFFFSLLRRQMHFCLGDKDLGSVAYLIKSPNNLGWKRPLEAIWEWECAWKRMVGCQGRAQERCSLPSPALSRRRWHRDTIWPWWWHLLPCHQDLSAARGWQQLDLCRLCSGGTSVELSLFTAGTKTGRLLSPHHSVAAVARWRCLWEEGSLGRCWVRLVKDFQKLS